MTLMTNYLACWSSLQDVMLGMLLLLKLLLLNALDTVVHTAQQAILQGTLGPHSSPAHGSQHIERPRAWASEGVGTGCGALCATACQRRTHMFTSWLQSMDCICKLHSVLSQDAKLWCTLARRTRAS